ncbi:UNVERIFIED_CONTAM: hypothetical protein ABIC26_002320 [Paenibacillus sp. PvR008]
MRQTWSVILTHQLFWNNIRSFNLSMMEYKGALMFIELFAAALAQVRVYVVSDDEELRVTFEDFGGVVEQITPDSILLTVNVLIGVSISSGWMCKRTPLVYIRVESFLLFI